MKEIFNCKNFHEILSDHNKRKPSYIVIGYKNRKITYSQLINLTNQIALFITENSNNKNSYIPVLADRSSTMIYGVLGVMKAGSVFIPLDVDYPANRISLMLSIVKSEWLITDERYIDKAVAIRKKLECDLKIIVIPYENGIKKMSGNNSVYYLDLNKNKSINEVNIYNDHLYVYFTSGSTGKPKGILGKHQSLFNFMKWQISEFDIDETCRVAQITTPCFDVFLRDIFIPLCTGGTICIPDSREVILHAERFVQWIHQTGITHIHVVPTLLRTILHEVKRRRAPDLLSHLKYVISASEVLKGEDVKLFYDLFGDRIRLINLYGTTETTLIKSIYYPTKEDGNELLIPIGKPITNAELYILNKEMKKQKQGEIGEIYIKTPDMTAGYIHQPELMKKSFVKNPLSNNPDEILYKTGDLGKLLPDGNILWLGRIDHQVKIRGIRIELAEIESYLLKIKFIKEVVVVGRNINGEKCLCAYMVSEHLLDIEKIRRELLKYFPLYMVPSHIIQIDSIPFLPNGKVNRNKLPDPVSFLNKNKQDLESPADEVEIKLLSIIKNIFNITEIGMNSDFFAIGGHSLKAVVLLTHINKEFNINITIADIFNNTIFRDLALLIKRYDKKTLSLIPKAEKGEYYPLTSAQKRLFLLSLIENIQTSYNKPHLFLIEGNFDRYRCEDVLKQIISRHDALRASFCLADNEPVQKFHAAVTFDMEYIELKLKEDDCEKLLSHKKVRSHISRFIRQFNLLKAPLFRACCIKCNNNIHLLMWDSHHIVCDGISEEIINKEFSELYNKKKISTIKTEYKDYVVWQNNIELSNAFENQEKYWLKIFKENPEPLNIYSDFTRPVKQSYNGAYFRYTMNNRYTENLKIICKKMNSTLFMVLFAAFNILISRYARHNDIVIGLPISVRNREEIENIIGMFVNTLAIRTFIDPHISFEKFLLTVKASVLETFQNQDYQFEKLIEKINIKRDLSRNPLFDVMFIMQNMDHESIRIDNSKVKSIFCHTGNSKFDITLNAEENGESLSFTFEYYTKLFKKETIERMSSHYVEILKQISYDPHVILKNILLLTKNEKSQILKNFNNTRFPYNKNILVNQLFEEKAKRFPGNIAIICNNESITYKVLNEKANQLAHLLIKKGIKGNVIVGLLLNRSIQMIISILAVLKAGGVYLPLDPNFPYERIKSIVSDSKCGFIISDKTLIKNFHVKSDGLDISDSSIFSGDYTNPEPCIKSDSLAYVIYTSGSTGKPKGVMIKHQNVVNFICGISQKIDFTKAEKFLALTTISFDIFVLELFVPLSLGKQIVLANENERLDPALLINLIKEKKVDVIQATPSRVEMYFSSKDELMTLAHVTCLLVGGEPFPHKLLTYLKNLKNTKIYNVYGPTETTVWSSVKDLTNSNSITIGRPISNTRFYVCDDDDYLQPIGIPGELIIGGDGVAAGYYKRKDLTSQKFKLIEFLDNEKVYKTGDLVRWLPNGEIEFIGRIDNQVKIRGFRVELGEIEKYISDFPDIKNCICLVKGKDSKESQLVAYYISDKDINISEIRSYISNYLPDYMIPEIYIRIDKIPYTPNNKIDKMALPSPSSFRPFLDSQYQTCRNETEIKLHKIWSDVLQIEQIGIHDNFFDLGGNSFLLIKMYGVIEKEFPHKLSVTDLFAYPTINKISECIQKRNKIDSEVKRKAIPLLELSHIYFVVHDYNESSLLEYEINNELNEKLLNMSKKKNTTVNTIFLSCYACVLSDISGKEKIPILYATENNTILLLEIDTASIETFDVLIDKVKIIIDSIESRDILSPNFFKKLIIEKNDTHVIPILDCSKKINLEINDIIEILLKIRQNNGKNVIVFNYNNEKLNCELLEDFFNLFIEYILHITNMVSLED